MTQLVLVPLARPQMAALIGGDDWPGLAAPMWWPLPQLLVQTVQWLADNPPGAGNYAYCKTGLP